MNLEPGYHCHISKKEDMEKHLDGLMPVIGHEGKWWLDKWFIVADADHPYLKAHSFTYDKASQILQAWGIK